MSMEDFYKQLLDNMHDGVYFVDRDRRITYWNKGAERISGYSQHQVLGSSCRDNLLNHVSETGTLLCSEFCPLAETMEDGQPREADVFLHHANGHRVPVHLRASPIRDGNGNIVGAVETFSSNAAFMEARRKLHRLQKAALIDPLTQIVNRRFLNLRLKSLLLEHQQHAVPFGIMLCDIDAFKPINDTYGHQIGDRVLLMVVNTLRADLRRTDIVGRWGGDEMICIFPEIDQEGLELTSEKLCRMVECARLDLQDASISVTISGGSTLSAVTDTLETLIQRADQLLYLSKSSGGNHVSMPNR